MWLELYSRLAFDLTTNPNRMLKSFCLSRPWFGTWGGSYTTTSNEASANGMAVWSPTTSGLCHGSMSMPVTGRVLPIQNRPPVRPGPRS
jgi:hypothetical protein